MNTNLSTVQRACIHPLVSTTASQRSSECPLWPVHQCPLACCSPTSLCLQCNTASSGSSDWNVCCPQTRMRACSSFLSIPGRRRCWRSLDEAKKKKKTLKLHKTSANVSQFHAVKSVRLPYFQISSPPSFSFASSLSSPGRTPARARRP